VLNECADAGKTETDMHHAGGGIAHDGTRGLGCFLARVAFRYGIGSSRPVAQDAHGIGNRIEGPGRPCKRGISVISRWIHLLQQGAVLDSLRLAEQRMIGVEEWPVVAKNFHAGLRRHFDPRYPAGSITEQVGSSPHVRQSRHETQRARYVRLGQDHAAHHLAGQARRRCVEHEIVGHQTQPGAILANPAQRAPGGHRGQSKSVRTRMHEQHQTGFRASRSIPVLANNRTAPTVEGERAAARRRRLSKKLETNIEEDILDRATCAVGHSLDLGRDGRRKSGHCPPGHLRCASCRAQGPCRKSLCKPIQSRDDIVLERRAMLLATLVGRAAQGHDRK